MDADGKKIRKIIKKSVDKRAAEALLQSAKNRKPKLLENPAILCALALDPRFCSSLEHGSKNEAIDAISNLWKRIRAFHCFRETVDDSSSEDEIITQSTRKLEYYMTKKLKYKNIFATNISEIRGKISNFLTAKHDGAGGTIYQFWMENQKKYPDLFEMSQIVFASIFCFIPCLSSKKKPVKRKFIRRYPYDMFK